ncbi:MULTISPECIES: ABC transporter ATP-binding protein [Paracoccus]|uniref:Glutathione import ATP-binding protein GsiA n=1 Tax=Paracoccus litorisediminis TaxID=2006130 RepID=A0A844HMW4_9RHOB|nr:MULTISPECIES: ATP-binding cassette domain-containing protein [Paracoccus]MBD9529656.1 ATP-binding cassette domain-containing protein [Paracoccus sp. PAR01]MTH61643.1 ATP-binding cassette domain-containing protein [Paracoccus litorisediminis]
MTAPLLEIRDLKVHFNLPRQSLLGPRRVLRAVDGVNLTLHEGECLSIVGESGCGKSTTALTVMGLQEPTSGEVLYKGKPLNGPGAPSRKQRARIAQMVFQDPYASLNPRQTIGSTLLSQLKLHGLASGSEAQDRVAAMLKRVGLQPDHARRFPHEFSGGQRQRIGIARALMLDPQILVLDEPVSALDVSIQAQIINLLMDLQETLRLSYIMISHDLSVVEHVSDRVAVMYFGHVVEEGDWHSVFTRPTHPYTRRLIGSVPDAEAILTGARGVPDGVAIPSGRSFSPDISIRRDPGQSSEPSALVPVGSDHRVRLAI